MIDREDGHHLEPEDLAMMVYRGDGMTSKERAAAAALIRASIPSEIGEMKEFARRIEDQRDALRGALEELLASGPSVTEDDLRTLAAQGHKQAKAVLRARGALGIAEVK